MREQEKREDQFLESLPDFRQFEDCREVTDPELAVPLYMLMEARSQYLQATKTGHQGRTYKRHAQSYSGFRASFVSQVDEP
jgi:hypothetical protein